MSGYSLMDGDEFDLYRTSSGIQLQYAPVPEPGAILGIAVAALGLGGLIRRRRAHIAE